MDLSDIAFSGPRPLFDKRQRESMVLSDILGTTVGTTPRSSTKHRFGQDLSSTLNVKDINGGRFRTTRETNPLSPRYTIRVQSSLASHPDPAHPPAPPRAGSSLGLHADLSAGLRGASGLEMATIGPVERSHPGWRPAWGRKAERDANLRTGDVPGAAVLPANALRGAEGGVWRKSARPRRGFADKLRNDDIAGSAPDPRGDTMWRRCGRQSDPVDPVYVALDGVGGAGLLERDPLSMTRLARETAAGGGGGGVAGDTAAVAGGGGAEDGGDVSAHVAAQLRQVPPAAAPSRFSRHRCAAVLWQGRYGRACAPARAAPAECAPSAAGQTMMAGCRLGRPGPHPARPSRAAVRSNPPLVGQRGRVSPRSLGCGWRRQVLVRVDLLSLLP